MELSRRFPWERNIGKDFGITPFEYIQGEASLSFFFLGCFSSYFCIKKSKRKNIFLCLCFMTFHTMTKVLAYLLVLIITKMPAPQLSLQIKCGPFENYNNITYRRKHRTIFS